MTTKCSSTRDLGLISGPGKVRLEQLMKSEKDRDQNIRANFDEAGDIKHTLISTSHLH